MLDYPGNVRELKNLIERLIVMSPHDIIKAEGFNEVVLNEEQVFDFNFCENCSLQEYLEEFEKKVLLKTLKEEKKISGVAKRLAVSNATLWRKLKKYGFQSFYTARGGH